MPAAITELIDKLDGHELVRDQLGALLKVEASNQELLATANGKDPRGWALRVFLERANPWSEFQSAPADPLDAPPIVNVAFETETANKSASSVVDNQQVTGTFNIDCYGYGIAHATDEGHTAGDEVAVRRAIRAARLVRNILMSGHYTWLGLRGFVTERWVQSVTAFDPGVEDELPMQQVVGVRVVLETTYYEYAPQVPGAELQTLMLEVKRADNSELLYAAQFDYGEDS